MALTLPYLKDEITVPTLQALGMYSMNAVNLVLGTIADETDFGSFRSQLNGGPGLGIGSMEEPTYCDCWRYIYLHDGVLNAVKTVCPGASHETFALLQTNDVLAVTMIRIKYWMVPAEIPTEIPDLAAYWKKYYNTPLGKGTVDIFIQKYNQFVLNPQTV